MAKSVYDCKMSGLDVSFFRVQAVYFFSAYKRAHPEEIHLMADAAPAEKKTKGEKPIADTPQTVRKLSYFLHV